MSAIPRGAASTADSRRWYLEVSGRRAGPFAWSVIVELAQAGALHPNDRVWRMGLASWSRADGLPDLAPLIREPALCARVFAPRPPGAKLGARRVHPLLLAPAGVVCVAAAVFFHAGRMPHPRDQTARSRSIKTVPANGFSPSAESLAALTRQVSAFEARYPFLTELRRADRARFEQLDQAVRLGLRRGAPASELNGYVAEAAVEIEGQRLAAVGDSGAIRFAMALRAAARTFRSSEPAQCAAILEPRQAATPVRSAAALAAIAPALSALIDVPATRRAAEPARTPPASDTVDANPRMSCDRLLLLYDGAATQTPDIAAAFVRAMQARGGS
jgi:hypothetical protein